MPEVFASWLGLHPVSDQRRRRDDWIEGIQLLSVYVILGILFFYLPEPQHVAPRLRAILANMCYGLFVAANVGDGMPSACFRKNDGPRSDLALAPNLLL